MREPAELRQTKGEPGLNFNNSLGKKCGTIVSSGASLEFEDLVRIFVFVYRFRAAQSFFFSDQSFFKSSKLRDMLKSDIFLKTVQNILFNNRIHQSVSNYLCMNIF